MGSTCRKTKTHHVPCYEKSNRPRHEKLAMQSMDQNPYVFLFCSPQDDNGILDHGSIPPNHRFLLPHPPRLRNPAASHALSRLADRRGEVAIATRRAGSSDPANSDLRSKEAPKKNDGCG
jgi:hypothetical protein